MDHDLLRCRCGRCAIAPDNWYAQLKRPAWSPPNAVFAPVWTTLYLCMAVSAWLVWKREIVRSTWLPLLVFLLQLAANAAWSWLFFRRHRIDLAFLDILILLVLIMATLGLFFRRSRIAGWLLIPYLAWVLFATALNYQFWRLNA